MIKPPKRHKKLLIVWGENWWGNGYELEVELRQHLEKSLKISKIKKFQRTASISFAKK